VSDVEQLMASYIAEHRRGETADPVSYLERAAPSDRRELAALIDAYLARSPRRPLEPQSNRNELAQATVESLHRSFTGQSGLWPALLPRLRARAGLEQDALIKRLALALGAGEHNATIARCYRAMEAGSWPADGVSDRVLEALANLLDSTPAALREAGRAGAVAPVTPTHPPPDWTPSMPGPDDGATAGAEVRMAAERFDEIDALFRDRP
jgi:hypothetical protein